MFAKKLFIIIIISSCRKREVPRPFLAIRPHHPSLLVGLLDNIPCPYRADVSKSLLVSQQWHVSVLVSIRECRLWVFQLCLPCLARVAWMVCEIGSGWSYSSCFVGCCFPDLFKTAFCILVSFPSIFFSMHFVSVLVVHPFNSITVLLGINPVLFHWRDQISILSITYINTGLRLRKVYVAITFSR